MSSISPERIDMDDERVLDALYHLPSMVLILDAERTVEFANESFCQFIDRPPEETSGLNLLNLLPDDLGRRIQQELDQLSPDNPNCRKTFETPRIKGQQQRREWTFRLAEKEPETERHYYVFGPEVVDSSYSEPGAQQEQKDKTKNPNGAAFHKITNSIREAFWVMDASWSEVLHANTACEQIYGVSYEELEEDPENWNQHILPEDLKRMFSNLPPDQIQDLSTPKSVQFRLDHPEKGLRYIELEISPIPEEGETQRLVGLASDITEEEKRLQESQQKFEAIFNSTVSSLGWLKPDGTVLEANQTALDHVDSSMEELRGQALWECPWWTHSEYLQNRIKEAVHKTAKGETVQFEDTYPLPEGGEGYFEITLNPVKNNKEEVEYIVPEVRDITAQKRLQEELEQQKDFLQTIIDSAPNFIFVKDWDGIYHNANQTLANFYDTTRDELIGRTDADFNPDQEEVQAFLEDDRDVMRSGEVKEIPEEPVTSARTGKTHWFQTTKVPLFTDQPVEDRQVLGVSTDITEKKNIREHLEKSLKEKETLLGEIHHRVKNNLQIIQSMLRMEIRESEEENRALQDCINRVYSMALLHEKLYQSEKLNEVDISSYLDEICQHLKGAVGTRAEQIDISFRVQLGSIPIREAVSCGLIVNELVTNALQHGFEDGEEGQINVSFFSKDENYEIIVEDNGHGLPEGVDMAEVESTGLRIIRSIVEYEFDGEINFQDDDGVRVEIVLNPESRDTS
jgi:PAS domain S-box-containing protein